MVEDDRDQGGPGGTGAEKRLGEVALVVDDLDRMQSFYADTIDLPLLREFPGAVFFDLGPGFAGHTQVLALFDRGTRPRTDTTTLDHLALAVDADVLEAEHERLRSAGVEVTTATHEWVSWRSLYVDDPEGNTVEFVSYDPTVTAG